MKYEGIKTLKAEKILEDRIDFVYSCDMRYVEQYHEVNVICSKKEIEGIDLDSIARKFHQNHDQLYGYSLEAEGTPVEIDGFVSIKKAKEDYGVLIDPTSYEIDYEETEKIRRRGYL